MLFRKMVRTAFRYKGQFISMIVMIAIGMGIFLGFNAEWYSLDSDISYFLEQTSYADFRLYNESGFSQDDIEKISAIDGVDAASRFFAVDVTVENSKDSDGKAKADPSAVSLTCVEDYNVSVAYLISGDEYDETSVDGVWLSDKYAALNGFKVGDEISFSYGSFTFDGVVKGLVKSAEYMICVADANQLMPDYNSYGFAYVSPAMLNKVLNGRSYWPQINILSDLSKEDMTTAVNEALGVTTLLLTKEDHYSYVGAQSEVEEGKTMGNILPVLFLSIAVLTMITTMHRITANEKTQIGILKALGFRQNKITAHYTSYGLFLGVVGTIIGAVLGFWIARMVVNPVTFEGTFFDMPVWDIVFPWYSWVISAVAIALLTLIAFLSVRSVLRGTAADALRPYTPKKVRPLAIEKTKLWNKFKFGTRWNLRDLWRHKARSVMTLIGIVGCTVLLVGGLGMKDTMDEFLSEINASYNYETRVNFTDSVTSAEVEEFVGKYSADTLASVSGEANGDTLSLEIYSVENGMIAFCGESGSEISLQNDGAYVCIRLAERFPVGSTIEFVPFGANEKDKVDLKVVGILRSYVSESVVLTADYADKCGLDYTWQAAFTSVATNDIEQQNYISGMQTKSFVMDSYGTIMEIMDVMVVVLVVAAAVLGAIVLYNLGILSYIERSRELATLKVVGFRDGKIGNLLISQNMWLTVLGVALGIPLGACVLNLLVTELASEYEMKVVLGVLTYLVSIAITFGVSLLVGLFVARKNKKINMVEALKSE